MTTPLTAHDLHRLADALEKDGYVNDLGTTIRSTFPLPSPPVLPESKRDYEGVLAGTPLPDHMRMASPSPADDWREACVVEQKGDGGWDAESPDRKWYLSPSLEPHFEPYAKFSSRECGEARETGNFDSESSARAALAKAPPYPGYTPPLPSRVEGDGTVDAKWVAEHPGAYTNRGYTYSSDGQGRVDYRYTGTNEDWQRWGGEKRHLKTGTRFLPLPPKDNKCEHLLESGSSSSAAPSAVPSTGSALANRPRGGSVDSLASRPPSPSTLGSPSASPNPSEPVASGDPETYQLVFMGGELTMQPYTHGDWVKYSDHANHTASLRTELADTYIQLSQSQHEAEKAKGEIEMLTNVSNDQVNEITRLQSELAGVRGREEHPRPLVESALVAALNDMRSGWLYIRRHHGDLSGVGWDRAQNKAEAALELHRLATASRPLAPAEVKK